MKPRLPTLFIIYGGLVFFDLLLILLRQDHLRWWSKPLLMPVLMFTSYSHANKKEGWAFFLILAALFFSWCGDVALQAENLFIPGLLSFLLAHVAYIGYFGKIGSGQKGPVQKRPVLVLPVLLYIGCLLYFLFPGLGALKLPVIVYSITIGAMLLMAFNTRQRLPHSASAFFVVGALLFVLSDSLLAIHLFVTKYTTFGLLVMATYAAAQYFLIKGALEIKEERM